jgi:hypothetical protein
MLGTGVTDAVTPGMGGPPAASHCMHDVCDGEAAGGPVGGGGPIGTSARHVVTLWRAGGRLFVALLPTREQVQPRALADVLSAYDIPASAVDMQHPNRIVRELASELGIDLLPDFSETVDGLFFEQDVHLTRRGHEVVARAIGDHLERTEGQSEAMLLSRDLRPERHPSFSADGRRPGLSFLRRTRSLRSSKALAASLTCNSLT